MPAKKTVKKTKIIHEESAFVTPAVEETPVIVKGNGKKIKIIIGVSLTAIVIFGTSLNLLLHYQKNQSLQKNPLMSSEAAQEAIVSKVGKLIELPSSEAPTIATVTDITKLKGQAFFQHASNGDVVLIYPKANMAILYDPTSNKIVELGPINNNQQVTASSSNEAVAGASTKAATISQIPANVTVALYNGTTIDGLTKKVQAELAQSMPNVTVVQNTNAEKQDYFKTIVIDLTGKQSVAAQQLASALHGSVSAMPSEETVPVDADILVILGKQN
jgi:LytR cell envelope-related transcriptional attenuator